MPRSGVIALGHHFYHLLVQRARDSSLHYTEVYSEFGASVTATVVELVLALVLILGGRGIVGVIQRLRRGGLALDDDGR